MRYVEHVYEIVRRNSEGMDSIYSDYIKQIVGETGLDALLKNKYLESCGVINGRQLYVLCGCNKNLRRDLNKLKS